jgi:hydroxymethylglutaryl-CoA synthase
MKKVGIDAISFDVPKIYLEIKDLAELRGIEAAKLEYGLGLKKMSFPDAHQDIVVFAANAVRKLILQEDLKAAEIDRIYLGTESSFDSSKPMASYLLQVLEESIFNTGDLENCDVVDLTFACIGGVDALQNSLDYIRANPGKKVIVVTSDIAKYDLASTGEYTQGAGALAMLVSENPNIISFDQDWTVSTSGVFDFFKPKRTIKKEALGLMENEPWHDVLETEISLIKDQPVFDGQYSNACYLERTKQAYLKLKKIKQSKTHFFEESACIVMHLPYCFQARRNFVELYIEDAQLKDELISSESKADFVKGVSKSAAYMALVQDKILPTEIASAEIGNLYSGSIFLSFLSALSYFIKKNRSLDSNQILFIAYGSGSKSKSFIGQLSENWKDKIQQVQLFGTLASRKAIDIESYLELHKKEKSAPVFIPENEYVLDRIEETDTNLIGARYYKLV